MPDSLYWLQNTLRALPAFLLVYGVVGVPAALLLLPRRDWSQRALVLCLAFIAGPALLTLLMFALGTAGGALQMPLLRPPLLLAGLAGLTLLLLALLWRKIRRTKAPPPPAVPAVPLAVDEKLLLALLAVAVLIRLVTTAYWPFTMYDTLWVYGFQGRLYTLTGFIPPEIGYYPQFLSLQYAYGQIMLGGIDDRAARMAVPFLHIGSLLAAYVLGARLVNRRTGIVLAALWGLYPHVSAWAHQGDLEIPLAFLFTTAAALFLMAWQAGPEAPRRQYALLAGLVFGVALWTKPTAGAFAWGVMLLVALDLAGALWRGTWAAFRRHFETACLTALACLPIGGLWYLRNVLLGHAAVDFPHASWLTRATRSGDLFGWLLLAAALLLLALLWRCWQARHFGGRAGIALAGAGSGLALLFAGLLPSMPWIDPARVNPPQSYLQLPEVLLATAGLVLLAGGSGWHLRQFPLAAGPGVRATAAGLVLALPYFSTWFYSYSYHYRLSFAIVPLLALPSALLLANALAAAPPRRRGLRLLYAAALLLLAGPGLIASVWDAAPEKDWLWTQRYPDDNARYQAHNPDMILVRDHLLMYQNVIGQEPVVIAPGEQRLPFFFPLMTIITDTVPTRLEALAGATHFIYGSQATWRYQDEAIPPEQNQVVSALGRGDVLRQLLFFNDGVFRYELYELYLDNRRQVPEGLVLFEDTIVFGDGLRLVGYNVSTQQMAGSTVFYRLVFQAQATPAADYDLRLSMVNTGDGRTYHSTESCPAPGRHGCYRTGLWDAGEFVLLEGRAVSESDSGQFIPGTYDLVIELFRRGPDGQPQPAPLTINGVPAPDFRLPGFKFG